MNQKEIKLLIHSRDCSNVSAQNFAHFLSGVIISKQCFATVDA